MSIIQHHPVASRVAEAVLRDWIGLDAETIGQAALDRAVRGAIEAEPGCDDDSFAARLAGDSGLRDRLVEEVIVAESWFFRDPQVFELLRRQAIARAVDAGRAPLRVLCVPCAAGEEPFSVAMTLIDAGVDPSRFVIDAVDVSRVGLERAKAATYSANAFRGADISFRDRWFRVAGGSWKLVDAIRHRVRFEWGNLLDDSFLPEAAAYDVIFCRNLLIYLTTDARRRAERVLDRLLAADGLLMLGAAEPPILKGPWVPAASTSMFTLRRGGGPAPAAAFPRRPPQARPSAAVRGAPAGERAAAPPSAPEDAATTAPVRPAAPATPAAMMGLDDVLREAGALANAGRHDDAIRLCQRHEQAAGPAAELSFLLAMLHQAGGDADRAETCLHKTLYLDANHEEALLALALAATRRGAGALAEKYRQSAARVLARKGTP
jgi:chemotaxis protein methyltransferase WspC